MKKSFIMLLVIAMGCFSGWAGAENVQTVKSKFSKPFNKLTLPSVWKLEENHKSEIAFTHIDDEDVSLSVVAGNKIKKRASLDLLQKQIEQFVQKKSKIIPLFAKSFDLDLADFAEAQKNALGINVEHVKMGKTQWLKMYGTGEIELTTTIDNVETTVTIPTRELMYATFIDHRLHLVTFGAPQDKFEEHIPLFESTMQMICK